MAEVGQSLASSKIGVGGPPLLCSMSNVALHAFLGMAITDAKKKLLPKAGLEPATSRLGVLHATIAPLELIYLMNSTIRVHFFDTYTLTSTQ
jgi:hypothetical protein